MAKTEEIRVMKRCPNCDWRIFDKITPTTGIIELKCPNCHRVVKINLSLRRTVKYRKAVNSYQYR